MVASLISRPALALMLAALTISSMTPPQEARAQAAGAPAAETDDKYTNDELDELVGPIALYPDELVAQILPSAAYPLEIVKAARDLEDNDGKMDEDAINALGYDESILALLHYPDVIDMLNEDLDWTTSLGDAFVAQQEDVMEAIQRFRASTDAAGNLPDTDEVTCTKESEIITISSADPEVVYVPVYDPQVVVVENTTPDPVVTFGAGLAVGAWLGYACSWNNYRIGIWPAHRHYWGGIRPGWGARPYWGPNPVRRSSRRTARRTSRRTTRRTARRVSNRHGAGRRSAARAGARTGARAGAASGAAAGRRGGTSATRKHTAAGHGGTRNQNYGGYRSHQTSRAHSQRGAASRQRSGQAGGAQRTTQNRQSRQTHTQRQSGGSYGGYRSGNSAQRHSNRGSHSRGGGGRRGGGRRR